MEWDQNPYFREHCNKLVKGKGGRYLTRHNQLQAPEFFFKACTSSACQQNPRILYNKEVQYWFYRIPPSIHILSQLNLFHALPTELLKPHFNIILPSMPMFLSLSYPHKNPACTSSVPICTTCLSHLILGDLIVRKISGEGTNYQVSQCEIF